MSSHQKNEIKNVVLAGVGGQGILLASRLISGAALMEGYDVKANEVHGMAQRGGSVIAQIRFGEKVYSPLVKRGTAQLLVAMEIIEAVRHAEYIAPEGKVYVNTQRIIPTTVSSGLADYPSDPEAMARERFGHYQMENCLELARKAGSPRCVNVVMCGWISEALPFSEETWQSVMEQEIKPRFIDMNKEAFEMGRDLSENNSAS